MEPSEVQRYWEGNAEAWTVLSRAGADVCRDGFNTPRFLEMLPDVTGLHGLDIGCGEGTNTRRVAKRCARMTAFDQAPTFVRHAQDVEQAEPLGIDYSVANALDMPFADDLFDFAVSFMCLMDMPTPERALRGAIRVIRPGGFLQFSILHPCWTPPHRKWVRDEHGNRVAVELAKYWEGQDGWVEEWTFGSTPDAMRGRFEHFKVPRFDRTLEWWINTLIGTGFVLERIQEPRPTKDEVARYPYLHDEYRFPLFIHFRVRKPG